MIEPTADRERGSPFNHVAEESERPGRMHLVGMWVDPPHRRRGIGQAVVERAVRWAEERQAREVILWIADQNIPTRMLYERVGFRPTGER